VPLFLLALLIVRGIPALLSIRRLGTIRCLASGLLQATSLPFIITASQIGMAAGLMTPVDRRGAGVRRPAVRAHLPGNRSSPNRSRLTRRRAWLTGTRSSRPVDLEPVGGLAVSLWARFRTAPRADPVACGQGHLRIERRVAARTVVRDNR